MKTYIYLTNCTEIQQQNVHHLETMIEKAKEIKYITFLKDVPYAEIEHVFPSYCKREDQGLTLKKDWHVRYYRSSYAGVPCVYIVHLAIEYIFIKTDKS